MTIMDSTFKLELQNHFGYILNVIRPRIQRGSRAQMIAPPTPGLNRVKEPTKLVFRTRIRFCNSLHVAQMINIYLKTFGIETEFGPFFNPIKPCHFPQSRDLI